MSLDALLAAVRADPDDDVLRRVVADWYEEHGEAERAELIRVGVELATADRASDRYGELQTRERQLLAAHAKDWFTVLDVCHRFRRGFVDAIRCDGPGHFLSVADRLFAAQPVRSVWIESKGDVWNADDTARLAASPHLSRVRHLGIADRSPNGISPEGLLTLTSSPYLRGLKTLDWDIGGYEPVTAERLFTTLIDLRPPCFDSLRVLGIRHTQVGDGGLRALLNSSLAKQLTGLDLERVELSSEGVAGLVRSGLWGLLSHLYLDERGAPEGAVGTLLAEGLAHSRLRRLRVRGPGAAFAAAPGWGRLEALDIGTTDGPEGARAVAASPHLAQLRRLRLTTDDALGGEVLEALAANPAAGRLNDLSFDYVEVAGERGVAALARSRHLGCLRELHATNLPVEAAGLSQLFASPAGRGLRSLWLTNHPHFDDEAVLRAMAEARLPHLTTLALDLPRRDLGRGLLEALLRSDGLPRLSCLGVRSYGWVEDALRLLNEARHIAWAGLLGRGRAPYATARLYAERFGGFDGAKHLDHEEPFFPWGG